MRSKLLSGAAALALATCTIAASVESASARPWGWRGGGFWPGAVAAGVVGGAVAAATSPLWAPGYYDGYYDGGYNVSGYNNGGYYDYYPGYAYAPPVAAGGNDAGWCQARYHSYNPATGTFTGYDGLQHPCP
jgi:hypothetical protein